MGLLSHTYTTGGAPCAEFADFVSSNAESVCNECGSGGEAQGDNDLQAARSVAAHPKGAPVMIGWHVRTASAVGAAAVAGLLVCAPLAAADPDPAVAPPAPVPAPVQPPLDPAMTPGAPVQALAGGSGDPAAAPPAGVPHLSSPENLPPGTTETPNPQTRLGYLRDLWHSMQTQEVSGSDALLLLTQRPMTATPGMQPTPPAPAAPAPAAPEPAPAPLAP